MDEDLKTIEYHISELRKRFDCVQVFCSRELRVDDIISGLQHGNTLFCQKGDGNIFARIGQVWSWLKRQEESERIAANKV